eukprot:scaffold223_cov248-Ochromonas_danica.AAC.2
MVSEKRNYYKNVSQIEKESEKIITTRMWFSVTGDNKKGSDCYDRTDSSCPPGTVYNDLNLSTIEATLGNALTVLGSWFGTVVENYPTEFYGRKPTLLFNCFIFIAGAAIACTGTSVYTLLIGRFFTGVGVGFSSGVPLVLLAEIATNATRGTITSLHQHVALLKESHHHTALPAHDEGLHNDDHLNETADSTPYSSDKDEPHTVYYDQAREVLVALRDPSHDVDLELKDIIAAVRADAKASAVTWKEVFAYREGFIAGAGLLFFQAITGINAVVSYSTTLFSLAGGVKSGMTTDEQARARRNPEDSTKLSQKKELQEPPGNDIEERSHSRMLDPSSYAAVSNHSSSKQQQDQPTNDNVHNDNNTTNINDDNGGSTSHQLVELTGIKTEIVLKDDHDDGNDHSGDNSSTSLPV